MTFSSRFLFAALFLLVADRALAQSTSAAFPSLTYPRSIQAASMGELGVTLMNTTDAMQYNPANLINSGDLSLTFFRNRFEQIGWPMPLTSISMSMKPSDGMSVGFEYTDWNQGTYPITNVEHPEGTGETFDIYERSFAGAFALSVGKGVSLGAEIRYALTSFWSIKMRHTSFSAGLSYTPVSLADRMHLGFSLMNFGTPVKYETGTINYPDGSVRSEASLPMPARIHLGADYAIFRRPLFDLTLALGFTKPIDKRDVSPVTGLQPMSQPVNGRIDYGDPSQSSFESLFTAWSDFPEDVTTHIGLAYRFKPLPIGGGISFFQEMYLGYFSVGTSQFYSSMFTHGARAGFEFGGIEASAGYAGKWHDNNANRFLFGETFTETFQFTLGTRFNPFIGSRPATESADRLSNLIVSGGYSHCTQLGRMKHQGAFSAKLGYEMPSLWSIESDFYLSDKSALLASFAYGHMTQKSSSPYYSRPTEIIEDIETISLESGYRYHPIPSFHPLFLQASLGIMRQNAVDDYYRLRHDYYTYDNLVLGCVLPLGDTHAVVMPKAGLRTFWWNSFPDPKKFSGYNQFELGLNVGYVF